MKRSESLCYRGRRHIPLPTGCYMVGCTDIMTSYSKSGVFARLYYPAQGCGIHERYLQWPLWIPHKEYINGYAMRAGICPYVFRPVTTTIVGDVYIPAAWNASLSEGYERFPIVVFSHGLGAWRTAYSTICVELASHGFVVAAVEHRDHSACASFYMKEARMSSSGPFPGSCLNDVDDMLLESEDEWNDAIDSRWEPQPAPQEVGVAPIKKQWLYYENTSKKYEHVIRQKQLRQRRQECVDALDLLESLNKGAFIKNVLDPTAHLEMFQDRLDLSKCAIAGHSFGGATTLSALAIEIRFKLGIALDPWMFPFFEDQSVFTFLHQPLLFINAERYQTKKNLGPLRGLLKSDVERRVVTIRNARHRDLCDIPFVGNTCLRVVAGVGFCTDRFTVMDITTRLMLNFLSKHLDIPLFTEESKVIAKNKKLLKEGL